MTWDWDAAEKRELEAAKGLERRMVMGEIHDREQAVRAMPEGWSEGAWEAVVERAYDIAADASARAGFREHDERPGILWRYSWDAGPPDGSAGTFECYSGSRSDADRQAIAHFHKLGLPEKVKSYDGAATVMLGLSLELDLDGGQPVPPPLPIFDMDLLDGPPPPAQRWALAGFVPAGEVTLWTGGGGLGKSLTAQQMGTCMASSLPFLRIATEPAVVLYVTAEDAMDVLHRRQLDINAMVSPAALKGKLHLSSLRGRLGNQLCTFDAGGRLVASQTFHALRETITATDARVVFLDNVAHLFAGNENDRGQVTQFVNLLYSLVLELGVTVVLIAHPNKAGDEFSGSTAWLNAVRSHLHLTHDKTSDLLTLTTSKANYARKGQEVSFMWLRGAYLHADDVPPDVASEIRETAQASSDNLLFLTCLREKTERKQHVSDRRTASNYAPKEFATMAESKGIGRDRLERAMDRLFRTRSIETGELPWRRSNRHPAEGLREVSSAD